MGKKIRMAYIKRLANQIEFLVGNAKKEFYSAEAQIIGGARFITPLEEKAIRYECEIRGILPPHPVSSTCDCIGCQHIAGDC